MTRDHVTCDIYLSVGVLIDRRLTSVISKYKYLADISLVYLFVFQTRGRWSENSNHLSPNTCRSASLINRVHQFICNCTIVNSMHVLMIQNVKICMVISRNSRTVVRPPPGLTRQEPAVQRWYRVARVGAAGDGSPSSGFKCQGYKLLFTPSSIFILHQANRYLTYSSNNH